MFDLSACMVMMVIALFGFAGVSSCIWGLHIAVAVSFIFLSQIAFGHFGVLMWSRCWDVLSWYAVVAVSDAGV